MPFLSISEAARLAGIDRCTLQRPTTRGTVSVTAADGSRGIELPELLQVYPAAAMHSGIDVAMPQDAARQNEAAPPAVELRHAQDKIAALEDKIADMRAQLEVASDGSYGCKARLTRFNSACYHRHARELSSGLLRRWRD